MYFPLKLHLFIKENIVSKICYTKYKRKGTAKCGNYQGVENQSCTIALEENDHTRTNDGRICRGLTMFQAYP